jgi:formylmethanofuran dehydrogenase subunit E
MMVITLNEELKNIEHFHGHIGPYAVIGLRMGKISNEKLGKNPFNKKAQVWTSTKPPLSCVIDGIQMSSGCTIGKGNLEIFSGKLPKVVFSNNNGKQVEIILKESIKNEIDKTVNEQNIISYSEKLYQKPDNELFEIR